ncbi:MAG: Na(+)/H(+) antiporter subunit C [Candidatus Methylomirabilales bacterium]
MTTFLAITIGVLFGTGTFLLLRRNALKVIIGLSLISHGANLLLVTSGGFVGHRPPIIGPGGTAYVDPLPQALVLTAIVISFGVTAFLLVLLYRLYQRTGTVDLDQIRRLRG